MIFLPIYCPVWYIYAAIANVHALSWIHAHIPVTYHERIGIFFWLTEEEGSVNSRKLMKLYTSFFAWKQLCLLIQWESTSKTKQKRFVGYGSMSL